jgi:hypothetical protein
MSTAEFPVPILGERGDIADNELPTTALRLSQNAFRSERGRLSVRPGYKILHAGTNPGGRIMGLGYFRTAAGQERQIAANQTRVWQFNGTTWVDITLSGSELSGADTNHVHFRTFPTFGIYKTMIFNGVNTPKIWDGSAVAYSNMGGTPGVTIDGTVVANRALLLQPPNRIKVSDVNNPEVYPAGFGFNIELIDGGDLLVGIEQLTRTSAAVLGEESQWVLRAQPGNNPIRAERVAQESGPMSSAVIIMYGSGVIYYLADDYNIYRFDGVHCQAIGWAMKPWITSNINVSNKKMAHGCYVDSIGKIFWFFPGKGQTAPNLGVHFDPRTGEMGRLSYSRQITASGRVRVIVTLTWDDLAGFTWDNIAATFPTWESFGDPGAERRTALGSTDGNVYIAGVGDGSDSGAPIETIFDTPLKTYAGWPQAIVPSTFETFFSKAPVSTIVELHLGYTDTLMGEPEYSFIDSFDLATDQRNDVDVTSVRSKRFVTIRHRSLVPKGGVEWNGGLFIFEGEAVDTGPTGDVR